MAIYIGIRKVHVWYLRHLVTVTCGEVYLEFLLVIIHLSFLCLLGLSVLYQSHKLSLQVFGH